MRKPFVLIVASTMLLAACGGGGSTTTASTTTTVAPAVSTTDVDLDAATTTVASTTPTAQEAGLADMTPGIMLGASIYPKGEINDASRRAAFEAHEAAIGRPLAIANEFFPFDKDWKIERLQWHLDEGRALMVSWNGTHADRILDGSVDELIRQRARWTADLGETIIMRFFWEPDAAKGAEWGYHEDPTRYHDVWRHIRTIFEDEGATNAHWLWTPTAWHFMTGSAVDFYPGDDVVDLIGVDGYLWSPCIGAEETATDVFGPFLDWAATKSQPIVVAEWGADEDGGTGSKARFVEQTLELFAANDRVIAMIAFDADDPGGRGCNFRIDSSAAALDAYVELANDPRLQGGAGLVGTL